MSNINSPRTETDPNIFEQFERLSAERSKEPLRETPILQAKKLVKSYDNHVVIPELDFCIEDIVNKSEIIAIVGPSGCGKSTLLRMIAGLERPTSGSLLCSGQEIEGPGMERGMIFQKYSSFPFLNLIDNIAYPLINVRHMNRSEAMDRSREWIARMHLEGSELKFPHQLSGGMQQRVAIARSLAMDAKILLMDEPFGALDRKIRWEMQDLIAELAFIKGDEHEFTIFIVTHDIPEAVYLGDRIWVMHRGTIAKNENCARPTEAARAAQGRKSFLEMVSWYSEVIDQLAL